jgi:hypothetical protein
MNTSTVIVGNILKKVTNGHGLLLDTIYAQRLSKERQSRDSDTRLTLHFPRTASVPHSSLSLYLEVTEILVEVDGYG